MAPQLQLLPMPSIWVESGTLLIDSETGAVIIDSETGLPIVSSE